jgi:subtilisin family serine protease
VNGWVPAWAAGPGGPVPITTDRWPHEVTYEWAFGGTDGAGVRVCVLDSGVDPGHPMVGRVDATMAAVVDEFGTATVVPVEPEDPFGHGTACAGVIRSLAPAAGITSVQVLGGGLQGKGAALLAGLRWAIDEGYDVVNLSLSTSRPALRLDLVDLCDAAYFNGTVICASAHNSPVVSFPWYSAAVVSVASNHPADAGTLAGARHYYNARPPVEFFAPGVGVPVAWSGGAVIRGTGNSFATPYLAGLCALLRSKHPGLTPFQVKTLLFLTSANVGANHDR